MNKSKHKLQQLITEKHVPKSNKTLSHENSSIGQLPVNDDIIQL